MYRLFLIVDLLGTPAWADFESGNSLYESCSADRGFGSAYCMAYCIGVADVLGDGEVSVGAFTACIPTSSTQGQVADVVSNWLARNPEQRHYSAASLVAAALDESFPC